MSCSRTAFIATLALGFLRIVIGLHFFLEGSSHLRDPSWSSAGFRKAAIGPLAPLLKADLPETGDWRETLGASHDADPTAVATIGSGPYQLKEYQVNDLIRLERHPNYWNSPAKMEQVVFDISHRGTGTDRKSTRLNSSHAR